MLGLIDTNRFLEWSKQFDLENNIGELEVKELGGTLNIGANYGFKGEDLQSIYKDKIKEFKEGFQDKSSHHNRKEGPNINIKSKKDK